MATISLTYNERNSIALRTIEYILSLGVFSNVQNDTAAKRRTLKAISDVRTGKNVTRCESFEDYLKAVAQ